MSCSKRQKPSEDLINTLYSEFSNEKHIFIFSVLGRSASTAFQRILNSSNEICVFGESMGILENLFSSIFLMEQTHNQFAVHSNKIMNAAFEKNKHNKPYPHSLNIQETMPLIRDAIINLYLPVINVKRFGFKEIYFNNIDCIKKLQEFFPNSQVIFLFRNPISQYKSSISKDWFSYAKDVDTFIKKYCEFASNYLEYNNKYKNTIIIENTILYDREKLKKLFKTLKISNIDDSLINDNVFSFNPKDIDDDLKRRIKRSNAYHLYNTMVEKSKNYFKQK